MESNERAPINTAYFGFGRRKQSPREVIQITATGLAKRKIVQPKEDAEADILAVLDAD